MEVKTWNYTSTWSSSEARPGLHNHKGSSGTYKTRYIKKDKKKKFGVCHTLYRITSSPSPIGVLITKTARGSCKHFCLSCLAGQHTTESASTAAFMAMYSYQSYPSVCRQADFKARNLYKGEKEKGIWGFRCYTEEGESKQEDKNWVVGERGRAIRRKNRVKSCWWLKAAWCS